MWKIWSNFLGSMKEYVQNMKEYDEICGRKYEGICGKCEPWESERFRALFI